MSDPSSARDIIAAGLDFLTYVADGSNVTIADSSSDGHVDRVKSLGSPENNSTINAEMLSVSNREIRHDDIWPPILDTRLIKMQNKFIGRGGVAMTTINAHMALLCVLQLRVECGLRGIRPSMLFGRENILVLCSRSSLLNSVHFGNINIRPEDSLGEIRTEFIMQCFRQLGSTRSSILYRVASLWKYSLHEVRIMHVNSLLELYLDELVDEMIPQVFKFAVVYAKHTEVPCYILDCKCIFCG